MKDLVRRGYCSLGLRRLRLAVGDGTGAPILSICGTALTGSAGARPVPHQLLGYGRYRYAIHTDAHISLEGGQWAPRSLPALLELLNTGKIRDEIIQL